MKWRIKFEGDAKRCPYCGELRKAIDPRELCSDCKMDFGHTFINEL